MTFTTKIPQIKAIFDHINFERETSLALGLEGKIKTVIQGSYSEKNNSFQLSEFQLAFDKIFLKDDSDKTLLDPFQKDQVKQNQLKLIFLRTIFDGKINNNSTIQAEILKITKRLVLETIYESLQKTRREIITWLLILFSVFLIASVVLSFVISAPALALVILAIATLALLVTYSIANYFLDKNFINFKSTEENNNNLANNQNNLPEKNYLALKKWLTVIIGILLLATAVTFIYITPFALLTTLAICSAIVIVDALFLSFMTYFAGQQDLNSAYQNTRYEINTHQNNNQNAYKSLFAINLNFFEDTTCDIAKLSDSDATKMVGIRDSLNLNKL